MVRFSFGIFLLLAAGSVAQAQQADACDQFAWPIARERALFTGKLSRVDSGSAIKLSSTQAVALKLRPFEDVQFTRQPERPPKNANSYGGILEIDGLDAPGLYQITLSAEGWIDVIQNDAFVKSKAFSGKRGCPEVRKSVQFELGKGPIVVQLSGIESDVVNFSILPVAQ